MNRIVILGGGIIGLSIAFELSCRKSGSITLIDQVAMGQRASWAGAGMLPAANQQTAIHPSEHLAALSILLHPEWSARLASITGIDNAYRQSGSLHLASTTGEVASMFGMIDEWQPQKIELEEVPPREVLKRFPFVNTAFGEQRSMAVFTPDAAQFDNRRHLEALIDACVKQSVVMRSDVKQVEWGRLIRRPEHPTDSATSLMIGGKEFHEEIVADQFVIAAGPWSQ